MSTFLLALNATAGTVTTTLQFQDLPGQFGNNPGNNMNGTYNGFAGAYVGGSSVQSPIICDDFNDVSNFPSPATPYYASTIDVAAQNGSVTLFHNESDYEAAAILLMDVQGLTGTDATTENNITLDQYAIWDLMSPNTSPVFSANGTNSTAVGQNALALATADAGGQYNALFSDLVIYTPVSPGTNQEFLGLATPEPSTFGLLFAGAGVLFLGARRKLFSKAANV